MICETGGQQSFKLIRKWSIRRISKSFKRPKHVVHKNRNLKQYSVLPSQFGGDLGRNAILIAYQGVCSRNLFMPW